MKKRPLAAILNTIEDTAVNLIGGSAGDPEWGIVKTSSGKELLLGMFRRGKLVRTESFDPVTENQQVVLLGATATKEVIVASTRYKVEIGNPEDKYETHRRFPIVHAYTTAAALSGDADTDRLNVNTALVNKINAYSGNNCTAYLVYEFDFTLGGATGNDALPVGTQITQATSTAKAIVGKIALSSGTFAGGDAAGTIWVYDDTVATIADAAYTWSWATSTLTQTNTTLVNGTGLACVDDSGYFVSSISRPGANWYGATQGFGVIQFEIAEVPAYAEGIGSVLAALIPRYDHSKQDVIEGFLDFELQAGDAFDTAKTYRKYVFVIADGDEDAMGGDKESLEREAILFCDKAATHLGDLDTAIGNLD